jgi:hypothetical protein
MKQQVRFLPQITVEEPLDSIGITLSVEAIYHRVQNDDMRAFVAKKEQEVLENGYCQN